MKKAGEIFLIVTLIALMTACGNGSISDPGKVDNNSGNALPENLVMLDVGEWPQNEYTDNIPQPESGTLLRGWIDPANEFCYLELSDIAQTEAEQYIESLKTAGLSEVEKVSEEVNNNYVSVGTLLTCDDTSVSISYVDDLFCMYIKNGQ